MKFFAPRRYLALLTSLVFPPFCIALGGGSALFQTGFEATDSPPYSLGQLAGQNGWAGSLGVVQNGTVFGGTQAVQFNAALASGQTLVSHSLSDPQPETEVVYEIEFQQSANGSPSFWDAVVAVGNAGFLGQLVVTQTGNVILGNATTSTGSLPVSRGVWNDFQLVVNYSAQTITGYVNGSLVGSLPFSNSSTTVSAVGFGINFGPGADSGFFDNLSVVSTPALAVSPNPSALGQPVFLAATTAPNANGLTTFYDGTTVLGDSVSMGNQAFLSTPLLAPGHHSLRARFNGDSSNPPGFSSPVSLTVNALAGGAFAAPSNLLSGTTARQVAVSDFDLDGVPDLAVANQGDGTVSVFFGISGGGFRGIPAVPVSGSPLVIATGDFNNDGLSDFVVAGSGGITIGLNSGADTFTTTSFAGSESFFGLAVSDFNNDGNADLALVNNSGKLAIFLGNGDGTFQTERDFFIPGTSPQRLAVGDFNGDGIPDVVVANIGDTDVSVFLGNGDGTFQGGVNYQVGASGPFFVVVADFNGDGAADIATSNNGSNSISVLLGNGNGTFRPAVTHATGGGPAGLQTGDFNGDGKIDLVVVTQGSGDIEVLNGNGDGTFQPAIQNPFGSPLLFVTAADVNSDGLEDVIVSQQNSANISVLLGTSAPDMKIAKTHAGPFKQGDGVAAGDTYTITVSNVGSGSTSALVRVVDTLPPGLSAATLTGPSWICNAPTLTCTNGNDLSPGASYPPITMVVTVAANAPLLVTNLATVSGGGEVNTNNDTATDPTTITSTTTFISVSTLPPANLSFTVDGTTYNSSQNFQWSPGSMHSLSTTSPQPGGTGTQYVFTNWSDAGAISHTVTAPTMPLSYQAIFKPQFQLSVSVNPSGGGTVSAAPGFYDAGATIQLQAIPASGFQFVSWTGPVASFSSQATTITLNAPQLVTANFRVIPISVVNPSVGPATVGVGIGQQFLAAGGFRPYSWSAIGLPFWLSLSSSGFLTGTPPPGSAGTYTFSVTVSDLDNTPPGSATITLIVNPAPLAIGTSQLPAAKENSVYSATLSASGGTTPYSWTGSGLPSWLSISASGTLSGTPPVGSAGGVSFNVTVKDAAGMTASANLQLAIASASGKPVITTPSVLPQATAGSFYTLTLGAIGGTTPYHWVESNLGLGLSINSSGVLSGMPTAPGTLSFTVEVNDSASPTGTAFQPFSLTIVPQPVAVTILALAEGHLNIPYQLTFTASGGTQQFQWSVLSGTLPPGLTLTSAGILSGTPTSAVTASFTIGATDVGAIAASSAAGAHDAPRAASPAATASFQLAIEAAKTDLALSAGSLVFTGVANGSDPPNQNISVISTDPNTPLPFSVTTDAPWLVVTQSGGTTPANVVVQVRLIGLQVQNYSGHITFSSAGLTPQIVGVSVSVAPPATAPPAIAVSPNSIQLSTVAGSTIPLPFAVLVKNSGVGSVSFSASTIGAPWLSVVSSSGNTAANGTGTVNLQADPTGLAPGFYLGTVEVDSPNSSAQVPVTLFLATAGRISLNFSGALIQARAGSPAAAPATLSFSVLGSDANPIAFTTEQIGGDGILTLQTTSGSATNQAMALVSYTVNTTGLAVGAYYGRILVTAPGSVDSPQTYLVVVNVSPVTQPPDPAPSPAGLVFVSGASAPPKQTVAVFTSSAGNVAYQAAASTQDGAGWLSVTPTTGILSSSSPAQLTVAANPSGLKPGVYRGSVSIAETNLDVRSVNVTLIVTAAAPASSGSLRAAAACSPSQLVITQSGLAGNFSAPAAWPQTIAVFLNDDCGNAITGGSLVADFSNGDPSQRLTLSDPHSGTYTATWTPTHNTAQMTITAKASATGFPNASVALTGSVTPNVAPVLAANGVLHNFYPQVGAPLAPGTIVEIFGSAMAATTQSANTTPLPTSIGGTSVVIGGLQAPLFFVSPGQINAQIPNELVQGNSYDVVVIANSAVTTPQPVQLNLRAPGVARFADGHVIAQHSDFSLVTAQSPAKPGEYLIIYLGGLGPGDQTVTSGTTSPSSPLDAVPDVTITVDGQSAPVFFSGLTPGLVGLYQVNFQVPQNVSSGDVMLQVTEDGYAANSGLLTVAH